MELLFVNGFLYRKIWKVRLTNCKSKKSTVTLLLHYSIFIISSFIIISLLHCYTFEKIARTISYVLSNVLCDIQLQSNQLNPTLHEPTYNYKYISYSPVHSSTYGFHTSTSLLSRYKYAHQSFISTFWLSLL